ncbi:MAG: HAMP domain-containing protein [Desulfobacterales bacterium]|nr:HAMP domain-containing protein [Desulfobacterales bacterium]
MIVSCEDCGKQYRIQTEKIRGERARFRCKACGFVILVNKPSAVADEPLKPVRPTLTLSKQKPTGPPEEEPEPAQTEAPKVPPTKLKGIGLKGKLMFFLLVPLMLGLAIGAFFSLKHMVGLSGLITEESSRIVTQMAERQIAEHARAVALQAGLYLLSHPELKRGRFQKDAELKKIAVQKVGSTGYTALHAVPDKNGIWRNWAHANPKIVGIDMSTLKKPMGKAFYGFWKVFSAGKDGKESSGYYTWQDADGRFRDKFMVCAPVKGTPYYVASTTYLDEFTRPVEKLKERSQKTAKRVRNINAGVMLGTIMLIGLIVFFYGRKVTGDIRRLSEVADRISIGELDAEIDVKSKDEIGELAEAISRMQDSLRLSIERLRHRH